MAHKIIYGVGTYGKIIPRGVDNDIIVGKYCSIAEGCTADCGTGHKTHVISTWPFDVFMNGRSEPGGHPMNVNSRNTGTTRGPIIIGNDVWLGEQVMIMSGVTIGDGAIIGLRSVVTKNIPPYAIAVGAPAVVKKFRFPPNIIERMLKAKWWDWPETKLRQYSKLLVTDNFEEFFKIAGV